MWRGRLRVNGGVWRRVVKFSKLCFRVFVHFFFTHSHISKFQYGELKRSKIFFFTICTNFVSDQNRTDFETCTIRTFTLFVWDLEPNGTCWRKTPQKYLNRANNRRGKFKQGAEKPIVTHSERREKSLPPFTWRQLMERRRLFSVLVDRLLELENKTS